MFSHNRRWTSVYKCLVATPMQSTCKATGGYFSPSVEVYDRFMTLALVLPHPLKLSWNFPDSLQSQITSHHFDILDLHWKRMETLNLSAAELIPWSRKKGITWLEDPGKITWLRKAAHIYTHTCLEMMKSIDLNIAYTKKMRVSKKRGNPKNHQFFFGDFLF